ncbi:ATP-binding cassette domain-containing protein [Flavobacteriaceae bacterium]|nr:ATP-binding cassette domain-containing protein [Flavobacteriaceae bacterium]|tara:strand:- start:23 stop:2332 length:2310 start_codon:yes stop_codon:yes gene_type:complete
MSFVDFKLYFYQNNKLFKKVAIEKGAHNSWIVGTGDNAHIKLNNSRVSRNHLQIIYQEQGVLHIQDLDSTNGTYLNGIKLKISQSLKHKDKIQLAGVNDILIVVEKPLTSDTLNPQKNIVDILKTKKTIFLGRETNCDIVLNHGTISKVHASITLTPNNGYQIKDLGSTNGTYVNGRKIKTVETIDFKDNIFIGRHQITLEAPSKNLSDELAITAIGIEKTYSNGVKGLKRMDLSIPSKSIIAIMGPSGCGKSTLLKALNGDTPPTKGKVFLFNLELSENWQYLKTQIGYVPQDDIVHQQLTVEQCLYFTAKLRLDNLSDQYIDKKIDQVLEDLNILEKKKNLISNLSGGQRKRVSIAVELMTDPLIMFLDEPTSPLDPQTVEDFLEIMKKLSERGTTVLMVTHKPEDLGYMDEVIFMAEGGNIVYQGDTNKYKEYFNVKSVVSVFSQISGKTAEIWIRKYLNPRVLGSNSGFDFVKSTSEVSSIEQFSWLSKRYFKIKLNDRLNSSLLLAQAPIIAILICLIYSEINSGVLFMVAISAIWLGAQNAAREIVSEQAIYKRERMFNLKILPYIFSKISVLSFFSIIQSAIFIFILFIRYNNSDITDLNQPFKLFLWMIFLSIASTFLGLLLSSMVRTTERAMTILPLILLPQIMLAGIISKISNGLVEFISYLTLSRWGVEGLHIIQKDIEGTILKPQDNALLIPKFVPGKVDALDKLLENFHETYRNKDVFDSFTATLTLDSFAILFMALLMILFIFKSLKSKDSLTIN